MPASNDSCILSDVKQRHRPASSLTRQRYTKDTTPNTLPLDMLNTISSLVSSIALGASAPATDVVDAEPATAKHKILVMNADTGAGSAMVHQLLVGRFRKSFAQVWCTVSCASRSGMLMDLGARVLEMSGEPDIAKLEEWLRVCCWT